MNRCLLVCFACSLSACGQAIPPQSVPYTSNPAQPQVPTQLTAPRWIVDAPITLEPTGTILLYDWPKSPSGRPNSYGGTGTAMTFWGMSQDEEGNLELSCCRIDAAHGFDPLGSPVGVWIVPADQWNPTGVNVATNPALPPVTIRPR